MQMLGNMFCFEKLKNYLSDWQAGSEVFSYFIEN